MTNLNQLQTLKIMCPQCGQKHLKTIAWLTQYQSIDCHCGVETQCNDIQSLVTQAVEELK